MTNSPWAVFWKDQKDSFFTVMKISTGYFAEQLQRKFDLSSSRSLFDYGCGPGFLIDDLAPTGIALAGADINEFYLSVCRRNHPTIPFITISDKLNVEKALVEEGVRDLPFDYIVLLSIVQYFGTTEEISRVVGLLKPCLKDDGKIVIADVIDGTTSSLRDAISICWVCFKKGKGIAFIRFMMYLMFSSYRKTSKQATLLHLETPDVERIAAANGFSFEKISGLTVHPSRTNYVLTKMKSTSVE